MRLINVSTQEFHEVFDPKSKSYAILSHAWHEGQEVSHQDWLEWLARKPGWRDIRARSGFEKISKACEMAREYGLDYVWVDTNCIDKTSSAELSEAINSMYSWYKSSKVCFAYLSDVNIEGQLRQQDSEARKNEFKRSRWFTRGWTLQELLAPRKVVFFSATWKSIGTRRSLTLLIESTTGIASMYLSGKEQIQSATVARRMSWAATRQTSRKEDMAYSLLGLFDINMPLLYGEGEKAFLRLQEEIIKVSSDQTIFAWEFVPQIRDIQHDQLRLSRTDAASCHPVAQAVFCRAASLRGRSS
ncbi:heterokaryon incompatibility protein-domain-containing protein [Xylariales sp. PMI_506]|nr:heterokaryon incompatibility protein-domain-containing protein [Xylariales sp. PMI_506]